MEYIVAMLDLFYANKHLYEKIKKKQKLEKELKQVRKS